MMVEASAQTPTPSPKSSPLNTKSLTSTTEDADDNAAILSGSLTTLFSESLVEEDEAYGDMARLSCASLRRSNFSHFAAGRKEISLLLAEQIELDRIDFNDKTCVELSAGYGLSSLLSATRSPGPSLVVLTYYPAETIIEPLASNVERNRLLFAKECGVRAVDYEWGGDPTELLKCIPQSHTSHKCDILFLSDLLYFDRSHAALVSSIALLLSRSTHACVYVAAGNNTPPAVCGAFFLLTDKAGLAFEEQLAPEDIWRGTPDVWWTRREQLSHETPGKRNSSCRWWIGKWMENDI